MAENPYRSPTELNDQPSRLLPSWLAWFCVPVVVVFIANVFLFSVNDDRVKDGIDVATALLNFPVVMPLAIMAESPDDTFHNVRMGTIFIGNPAAWGVAGLVFQWLRWLVKEPQT